MSKKNLWLAILIVVMAGISACGGASNPTSAPDSASASDTSSASAPATDTPPPATDTPVPTPEPVVEAMPLAAEPARSEAGGIEIKYPAGWETMEMSGMVLIIPDEETLQDESNALIVMVMGMSGDDLENAGIVSLDDIEKDLDKVVGEATEGLEILSSERTSLAGKEAISFELAGTDEDSGMKVAGRILITVFDNRAAVVMGMGPEVAWTDVASTFDTMLETVAFFEPTKTTG